MEKIKRKNLILTGLIAFVVMFSVIFSFTGCKNDDTENNTEINTEEAVGFECSGKTFVYDSWEATSELDEADTAIISGYMVASYSKTQFIFNTDGTYIWENSETHNVTWQGTWQIVENTLVLVINGDGDEEVLPIIGTKFYVTQQMSEENSLHIYFKVA